MTSTYNMQLTPTGEVRRPDQSNATTTPTDLVDRCHDDVSLRRPANRLAGRQGVIIDFPYHLCYVF